MEQDLVTLTSMNAECFSSPVMLQKCYKPKQLGLHASLLNTAFFAMMIKQLPNPKACFIFSTE